MAINGSTHSVNSGVTNAKASRKEKLWAFALLAFVGFCAFACISKVMTLRTHYSLGQFLPAEHPLLKADRETRAKFFLDQFQPAFATLALDKGDWLETDKLQRLEKATNEILKIEGVGKSFSIATIKGASQGGDELAVGNLLSLTNEKERRDRVLSDKFLTPLLVSKDGRRALVVMSMADGVSASNEQVTARTEKARAQLQAVFPEAKVAIGGIPIIQMQLTSLVKKELVRFMGLALVASCITLLFVFSSWISAIIPFVAILVTNVFVLAMMAMIGYSLTVLAVTIPILVSCNVLALCTHTMLRFVEDAAKGMDKSQRGMTPKTTVVFTTLKSLFLPNLMTAMTTAFGFATLSTVPVPVIHEFGIAVTVAILTSWLITSLVLFPLHVLLPVPVARHWVLGQAGWVGVVFRHRPPIVAGFIVVAVTMAIIGQNLHWSARLFDDLPKGQEARVVTEEVDKLMGGMIPYEIVISKNGASEPWNDPSAIKSLDGLLSTLRTIPEIGSAVGLPDLLRQAMGNPTAEIPTERAPIAESWFLLSMSEESPLKTFLTSDGGVTRLALRLHDMPADQLENAMTLIEEQAKKIFPDASVSVAGTATTVHKLNNELSRQILRGFWEALAVISILIFFIFRMSWRWTFLAVLPNLIPAAVLLGVLALAKTPIKPGVVLVFSIALGIAFDNTIYLMKRLQALVDRSGNDPAKEIDEALRLEGNPCIVSTMCLLSGFAVFVFSEFEINRTFGIYMIISLSFGLVGDLVFLPGLIKMMPGFLASKGPRGPGNLKPSTEDEMKRSSILANVSGIGALIALTSFGAEAQAAPDANAIMKNVESRMNTKDEKARIKMKVVESNGSAKERELEIMRKAGGKHQVLVRLKAPSDVSGIALLSVSNKGSEDQWLYMPSQKKARRVVAGNRSQKFLDTEFSLEDFSASTYAKFTNKVVKEEGKVAVIESSAKSDDTSYSKIVTWVDTANYQVQKSEYFDKSGTLLKTMVFRDYKKFGDAWRAQNVEVKNMQNKRSTVLQLAAVKVNAGLSDKEFTQSALEEED